MAVNSRGPNGSSEEWWGGYGSAIRGRLAVCAGAVAAMEEALNHEAAGNRHFVHDKAAELLAAARRIVEFNEDLNRWVGACGEPVELVDGDDKPDVRHCDMPAGHAGEHDYVGPTPADRLRESARQLASRSADVSRRLVDTVGRTRDAVVTETAASPEDHESLTVLGEEAQGIATDASHLARRISAHQRQVGMRVVRSEPVANLLDRLDRLGPPEGPTLGS